MAETDSRAADEAAQDAAEWAALMQRSEKLSQKLSQQKDAGDDFSVLNPSHVAKLMVDVASKLFADPGRMRQAQAALHEQYARLGEWTAAALRGEKAPPLIAPAADDRRFKDEGWVAEPLFGFILQYYLFSARWLEGLIADVPGIDDHSRRKAQFYLRQFLSAIAPSNFVPTNPKVLRSTLETRGKNLRKGFSNLLDDLERSGGQPLRISLSAADAFEPGRNLAMTPGKVIDQNDLAQLIQYAPSTETVYRRPLLIVPPWINKYYVLDLQEKNSMIRWLVGQGHTVFTISWVNPNDALAAKTFDDYVAEGPLHALDVIREVTGEPSTNAIGYCIGGTLLACTLAHLAARGDGKRISAATFFTTMLDFTDPGELAVFIDEEQIGLLERHMGKTGFLDGANMAQVFRMLRENDLIWSAFVNNYLLGKEPPPFDILHWNSDSTRMPGMMHKFYLREMYLNNRLKDPDALTIAGTPIDLRRIKTPGYVLATREDHIAPWRSCFAATRLLGGPVRFVLSESGHIAGVINPPTANKYGYWVNARRTKSADRWLAAATRVAGSWWPDWSAWVARYAGAQVPARLPGGTARTPIEDAPGSYVRVRYAD